MILDRLKKLVLYPATIATTLLATLGGVLHVPYLVDAWMVVWLSSGQIAAVLGFASSDLAPQLGIPQGPIQRAALIAGLLWAARIAYKIYNRYKARS